MTAEILCVGTELLLGNIVNTNAAFLSRELAGLGIAVYHEEVVGDNSARLAEAVRQALGRSDILITSGGLGPTYDDLTKETVAECLGLRLVPHEETLRRIHEFFRKLERVPAPNNEKQAMIPEGAHVFNNNYGTAPALAVRSAEGKLVIMLPGPPRELEPMFLQEVKPYLLPLCGTTIVSKIVNVFGVGESDAEHRLRELMEGSTNPTVAPYAKTGEVELRVTCAGADAGECGRQIDEMIDKIRAELGRAVYGIDAGSLQGAVAKALTARGLSLATAESCTGGYIGKRLTEIAGASGFYRGGVIAYSNDIKMSLLGVAGETLEKYGAVSEEVALEMARGAAERLGADIGLSSTGIAGPGGGRADKPVGTVWLGIWRKGSSGEGRGKAKRVALARGNADEREYIRYVAASHALAMVLGEINGG